METGLEGLFVLEPKVFGDDRGYFLESYNHKVFHDLGIKNVFVQDNESLSSFGTLRGLHFQRGEFAQAKLVRVVLGSVLDVVVDIRPQSPTFGKSFTCEINDQNKKMMMIPRGFAHGFVVLSEKALFQYKCDNLYSPANEGGIRFDDPVLLIDWRVSVGEMILSDKDKKQPLLEELSL
jgi:dTDP-4-dehydrorhamnose 3,5-epimerase